MGRISLAEKLTAELEQLIKQQLKPNDKLPSERSISEQYHVSRNTVRAALNQLFLRGLIYRSTGKGTFVAERLENRIDVAGSFSFTRQMGAMNRHPESRVEGFKRVPASPHVADRLQVNHGAAVFVLDRLRLADRQPLMVERSYLPAALLPGFDVKLLQGTALYDLFAHHYGIHIASVDESFYADLMTAEDAALLAVGLNSPCLKIQRTTFTDTGEIIEYTESVARADKFVYHVHHVNH